MKNSLLVSFLRDTLLRLTGSTPKYHRILRNTAIICGFIVSIPEQLKQFHISVPTPLSPVLSEAIAFASLVAAVVAQLAVENPDDNKLKI